MQRDYSSKGVDFFYIYKTLAHPTTNGYVTPFTIEERLMHVAEAQRTLGSRFKWLCDTMDNDLKHALGDAPNSEFVVDPSGKIVRARRWSRPQELRQDLEELVGPVDRTTTIDDLDMERPAPPKRAPTGVVARVELPGRMTPLIVEPIAQRTDDPFYVKLRAEVDPQFFQQGEGTLYLGFFLDPLHEVHWNNRAAAVGYDIDAPEGISISPQSGTGPDVKEDADADPREFLVDVSGSSDKPIKLKVTYFACDDAETFCKPVTQYYEITLARDPDGGSRRGGGGGGRFAGGFGGGRRGGPGGFGRGGFGRGGFGPGGFGPPDDGPPRQRRNEDPTAAKERRQRLKQAVALFKKHDKDDDGQLDQQEWARIQNTTDDADDDSDGQISLQELLDWLKQSDQRDSEDADSDAADAK